MVEGGLKVTQGSFKGPPALQDPYKHPNLWSTNLSWYKHHLGCKFVGGESTGDSSSWLGATIQRVQVLGEGRKERGGKERFKGRKKEGDERNPCNKPPKHSTMQAKKPQISKVTSWQATNKEMKHAYQKEGQDVV